MVESLSGARAPLMKAAQAAEVGDLAAVKTQALKALSFPEISGIELIKAVEMLLEIGQESAALRGLRKHCEGKAPRAQGFAQLGALHFEAGKTGPAARALERALKMNPGDRQSAFLLADLRLQASLRTEAEEVWHRVFAARPADTDIRLRAASQMASFGAQDAAKRFVAEAEPLHDDPKEFAFMAAAITGTAPPPLPDPGYIARFFDRTAEHYNASLQGVQYRGPEILSAGLAALKIKPGASLSVLDAGCGSGLSAPVLTPVAQRLDGLDISPGILEEAAKTGAYNSLFTHDLARASLPEPEAYDLVTAMDVLIYCGDLTAPLTNMAQALKPGGRLFFTAEGTGKDSADWALTPSGRYRHSLAYINDRLTAAGFTLPAQVSPVTLRNEFRRPVPGLAIAATRT